MNYKEEFQSLDLYHTMLEANLDYDRYGQEQPACSPEELRGLLNKLTETRDALAEANDQLEQTIYQVGGPPPQQRGVDRLWAERSLCMAARDEALKAYLNAVHNHIQQIIGPIDHGHYHHWMRLRPTNPFA
jgi:hypothetical protein